MPGTAFFDLDSTLLDCNSGKLWLRAEWQAGRVGMRDVAWASFWMLKYGLGRTSGLDEAFMRAIATLEGLDEAEMATRTRVWFDNWVASHLRPGAQAVLDGHRARGERCVLATSGTSYAADAAMAAFGLDDAIGTTLEVHEGRFTGRIGDSALGDHKLTRVQEWAARQEVDLEECTFYTDSISDLALLEAVGHPVLVHPDRALAELGRQRGWLTVSWSP